MYHAQYGEKTAKDEAEVTASLADGWSFDPRTDPAVRNEAGAQAAAASASGQQPGGGFGQQQQAGGGFSQQPGYGQQAGTTAPTGP
jgi:hypothetical protein